jgi:hypothetical protein
METRKVWPETIVSGFFYFAAIMLVIFKIFGFSYDDMKNLDGNYFDNLGIVGILSGAIIGGSYVFGHLFGKLMAVFFDFLGKSLRKWINDKPCTEDEHETQVNMIKNSNEKLVEELGGRYAAKYFYRSMIGGVLSASIALSIYLDHENVLIKIWSTAVVLVILFVVAFFKERSSHSGLRDAMKKDVKDSARQ